MQPLTEILDWLHPKDFNLDNYSKDIQIVCFLEADLDYSHDLHDSRYDYPLAGEKVQVAEDTLSAYQL